MKNLTCTVVYGDVHVPFQDRAAVKLFRRMVPAIIPRPTNVVCLGDFEDNYPVSRYDKNPAREVHYQDEIDEARYELSIDRQLVDGPFDFIGGNHERRTKNYVASKARALHDLRNLKIQELFGLAKLDITYHEKPFRYGDFEFMHGDEELVSAIYPARSMYQKRQGSFAMGHVHRFNRFYNILANGDMHQAFTNPCLCHFSQEYVRGIPQWQKGFSKVLFYGREVLSIETFIFVQKGGYLYATMDGVLYRERVDGPRAPWSRSSSHQPSDLDTDTGK